MLTVKEASYFLNETLTPSAIKKALFAESIPHVRLKDVNNGIIKIGNEGMRALMQRQGFTFKNRNPNGKATVVTIGCLKGGVNKTTITLNTAIHLANIGARVAILDCDPDASISSFLMNEEDMENGFPSMYELFKNNLNLKDCLLNTRYEGLKFLGCKPPARLLSRIPFSGNPKKLWKEKIEQLEGFDVVFLDVPPSYDSAYSAASYLASHLVVMPSLDSAWSIDAIGITQELIEQDCKEFDVEPPEQAILMTQYSNQVASREAYKALVDEYGSKVLNIKIPHATGVAQANNNNLSVFEAKIRSDVRNSIVELANFILPLEKKELLH